MDKSLLERAAHLARLDITDRQDTFLRVFAAMAEYGAALSEAEALQPEEASACPLREDTPTSSLPRAKVLMGAARAENGCIVTPRAFD